MALGPSGSGKTTLLNLIGAIEPPMSGRIPVLIVAALAQLPAVRGIRRTDIARIVRERSTEARSMKVTTMVRQSGDARGGERR